MERAMARKPAPGTRQRILAVAARLFGEHGVRPVGMQRLVDETGLGKSLVYREFAGKDDLVAAWLRESHESWSVLVDAVIRRYDGDPARQLLAVVEFYHQTAVSPAFHGCPFYATINEFRDTAHPGRREAIAHLEDVRERIHALAGATGATDPEWLADVLMLLIGGLLINGPALGSTGPAEFAVSAAASLIRQHCSPETAPTG
jgi:AcrR family transcriptional regulator